jgi:hypothetical protein
MSERRLFVHVVIAGSLGVAACFNPPAAPPDGPLFDVRRPMDIENCCDGFDGPKTDLGPWGPASAAFTAMGDDDPTLTDDLLEMYFNRSSDIYVTTRATTLDPWSTPTLVAELSSSYAETTPEIVGDGLTIYLASNRTLTAGREDIFKSTRQSRTSVWTTPIHVAELSSVGFDGAATRDANDLAFVLYSDRNSTFEIYETVRTSTGTTPWPSPSVHSELSSGVGDADPMLSLDRSTIYYDSSVSGGGDLYMATRPGFMGTFGTPQAITELNTALYIEEDPWVSADGHHVFFASNRDGTEGIYEASR